MSSIKDRLVKEAYHLTEQGSAGIAGQTQFASLYLDTKQGKKFLELCLMVRQSRLIGQRLLDEIVATITGKPNVR